MSQGYDDDISMYESSRRSRDHMGCDALLAPISKIGYPRTPLSFTPETPLAEVLAAMAEKRIGAVAIVDEGKIVGIFAERDVLIKGLYDGQRLDRPVREFMTTNPDCLTPDDPIAFGLNRMVDGGYRHVPLIRHDRTVVGMLVMRDVIGYIESFFPREAINVPPHSEHNPPDHNREGP